MKENKRRVYFFRMFICIAVIVSTLVIAVSVVYERAKIEKNNYDVLVSHVMDYQADLASVETRVSVARTISMLLSEYDCVKRFAETAGDYNSIDFKSIIDISEKIADNQTSFSNLEYRVFVTGFNSDIAVCGGAGLDGRTISLDEMYSLTLLKDGEVENTFLECVNPGIYNDMIVTGKSDACYVTKCVYDNRSCIYIVNKFLPVEDINYSQKDDTKIICIGKIGSRLSSDRIADEVASYRRDGILDSDQIIKIDLKFFDDDVFCKSLGFQNNIIILGSYDIKLAAVDLFRWIVLILAGILISLLVSFVVTKTAYIPIDRMINVLSPGNALYENELEYIIGRLEDIKNANSQLNSTLNSQREIVSKKVLSDILNGYIWGSNIDEYAKQYGLDIFSENSVCILFECNDSFINAGTSYANDEIRKIMANIFAIIEAEFSMRQIDSFGFIVSSKRVLFVARDRDSLKSDIIAVTDIIRTRTSINIVAIMSDRARSFEELRDMYSGLLVAVDKKLIFDVMEMLTINDLENQTALDWYYPISVESELMEYVINGDKEKMLFLIKKLFDYNAKSFDNSVKNLKSFNFSMSVTIKRILQKINKSETEVFKFEPRILKRLISTDSASETFSILKMSFEALSNEVDNVRNMQPVRLSQEIYDYINMHICNDISLTEISDRFNVSVSYIGKVLKDNYNVNFKSYVNEMRVKKAMEIMDLEPNTKIKDVSEMVGFNSSTSFIRVFQRIAGLTPKQYLESKSNDSNSQ